MTVPLETMRQLVGWRFPGGHYEIPHWENFLLTDVMESPPLPDGLAHPAYCFHAPLAGMGMSYGELFAVCHAESDDAVRAGEYIFDIHRPLVEGARYRVDGEIVDVDRKRGGRIGLFDLVTFRLDMRDEWGEMAMSATNSWVFLRSES